MPAGWGVVVVGPSRVVPSEVSARVRFTRESPAGGGPLAGIAAGLDLVTSEVVCVVAGDTPRAGEVLPGLVSALTASPEADAAVASDGEGQPNPVLAAYSVDALRGTLPSEPADRPARVLLEMAHVLVPADVLDVDTRDDLENVERQDPNAIGTTQR
ncbi:hypothetical protein N803_12610 [Knoellia subterranea KCTC 19937]|uniref:MobA-like NTP transferase domain-containing protein n=2 Tax=Knoellia TaxID=136099 RepID=A0A0A0JQM8_9MICO|nr:hypothetical protein N803_12610 [Knoellia subterranea KCTC 19937]